jgi:hypothetical protein
MLLLFHIYTLLWGFRLSASQYDQPPFFLIPLLPLLYRLDIWSSSPGYSLRFYSWRNLLIFQPSLCLTVNHSTYAFSPSLLVGNSCPCPHSPECWPVDNFSPWVEMAPSYGALPWVSHLLQPISCTFLILIIWLFIALPVSSLSP